MEPRNFDYSPMNIPIADEMSYMMLMMNQFESFITRARWKVVFYLERLKKKGASRVKERYGFKSKHPPPAHPDLEPFEQAAYSLLRNIQYENKVNAFQRMLAKDVKEIALSPDVYVEADKTGNLYKMSVKDYNKLLAENVTKCYEKAGDTVMLDINSEAKVIATRLELADRMEVYAERNAFITIKDHKPNFKERTQCRLINPAHPEMGVVSKKLLEKACKAVRESSSNGAARAT